MKVFLAILLLAGTAIVGCSSKSEQPIKLTVRVDPKGAPYFTWDETLLYETKNSGLISWPNGANLEGTFRRSVGSDSIKLNLNLHIDDHDLLTVQGDSQSALNYMINFAGITNVASTSVEVKTGDRKIKFTGILDEVYDK